MPKLKIALLAGGISGEREISLKTGEQIYKALDKDKYEITKYDPKTDLKRFFLDAMDKKFDLVFPALHGPFGEDGRLQGMLDMIGVPYVFSGCLASALAMDKEKSKLIAKSIGLAVAQDIILTKNEKIITKNIIKELSLPIFIKPADSGSSVGMSMAKNEKELEKGISKAFEHSAKIILERFIKGRELTVPIMGNPPSPRLRRTSPPKALPVIEIIPKVSEWFDVRAKYEKGGTDEICPAKIPDNTRDEVQLLGVKIFNAIGCKDLARVDFIWDEKDNKLYFLEINTIPGMTETSLVPKAAKAAGMEFGEFLDGLIEGVINS
jgi:D-alanine-D-alanine ligase